jgi:hypothetical protein
MKTSLTLALGLGGLALLAGGCATATLPRVTYPVTYQIQLGNTQVRSDYGPQNLNVNATQDVTAEAGEPLYYQVSSPVLVNVYAYDLDTGGTRVLLGSNQGTVFSSSVTPTSDSLRFVFSVAQANTSGVVQFTISDQPISPRAAPAVVAPPPEP